MGLFGSKVELEVSAEPTALSPGDEVRVRSELGEPDKKTRSARVRLVYVNSYRYEDTDSDGDRTTRTRNEEIVVAEEPLRGAGDNGGPAAGSFETVLRVPDEVPPTVEDAVEWMVKVTIDRKSGRDVNEEIPVTVASAPDALAAWSESSIKHPSEARMDIEVDRRVVHPGERIGGSVAVTANEDLEGRALRVRLRPAQRPGRRGRHLRRGGTGPGRARRAARGRQAVVHLCPERADRRAGQLPDRQQPSQLVRGGLRRPQAAR
jgi:hypothetical protein